MNLGHCLGDSHSTNGNAAMDAIDIAYGTIRLAARVPTDSDSVSAAESVLGASPRPVYCFVGCLHPGLGTVGLIFDRSCCDDTLQGVSRCDTGGLAGGVGTFVYVPVADRATALLELSYRDRQLDSWLDEFTDEISSSYPAATDYAQGERPDTSGWTDARAECLEAQTRALAAGDPDVAEVDRRVWTWEARLNEGPAADRVRFLVLSAAQRDALELDQLRLLGELPNHISVITGRSSAEGPEELFASLQVANALASV